MGPISGHHRGHQIYRGQRESQDANLLKSCDTMVSVGPTEGTIGSLGAPLFTRHDDAGPYWGQPTDVSTGCLPNAFQK